MRQILDPDSAAPEIGKQLVRSEAEAMELVWESSCTVSMVYTRPYMVGEMACMRLRVCVCVCGCKGQVRQDRSDAQPYHAGDVFRFRGCMLVTLCWVKKLCKL